MIRSHWSFRDWKVSLLHSFTVWHLRVLDSKSISCKFSCLISNQRLVVVDLILIDFYVQHSLQKKNCFLTFLLWKKILCISWASIVFWPLCSHIQEMNGDFWPIHLKQTPTKKFHHSPTQVQYYVLVCVEKSENYFSLRPMYWQKITIKTLHATLFLENIGSKAKTLFLLLSSLSFLIHKKSLH